MVAALTDKFKKVGSSTVTTLSSPGKALAANSITVGSTANYPTDTGFVIAIRQVDSNGALVAGTYTEWPAIVTSATTLTISTTPGIGTDQVYPAGSTTQVFIPLSRVAHNALIDALLQEHDQDGTHGNINAGTITASGTVSVPTLSSTGDVQIRGNSLETIQSEQTFDYIASGGVWSGDAYASTRNASMTALVCYIGGRRGTISAVTARTFTASRDTYVDVLNTAGVFTLVYTEVTNNAASPALAANSIRLGIIVTGASNIAAAGSVNQGQYGALLPIASSQPYEYTDSLGNIICPRDPQRILLGYKQSIAGTSFTTATDIPALAATINIPVSSKGVIISFYSPIFQSNGTNDRGQVEIREGATTLQNYYQVLGPPVTGSGVFTQVFVPASVATPGVHTYKITGTRLAGSGSLILSGSSTGPQFIRVDLGR